MSDANIWLVILALGAGTYLIRFSFLGLIGSRRMPAMVLRLLRYTPVAIFPGIIVPLVISPAATGGAFDPARAVAAALCLLAAIFVRNVLVAIGIGAVALYLGLWLF